MTTTTEMITVNETAEMPACIASQTAVKKAAANKAAAKAGPTPKKVTKAAKTAKTLGPAKAAAKKAAKAAKHPASKRESKSDLILGLIARKGGATLAELMEVAGWQAHSVRGFISMAGKTHQIESSKNEAGERVYKGSKT
jgi:hypothetical protein